MAELFPRESGVEGVGSKIPYHPLMSLPPLNRKMVANQVENFIKGDNHPTALITQLLFLVTWYQVCIERK